MKVVYIAGAGRSGSTVLGNILGQVEGFETLGELRLIWDRGLVENWTCGCGSPFRDCGLWRAVLDKAFGGMDRLNAGRIVQLRESCTRTQHIPSMLLLGRKRLLAGSWIEFVDHVERLYRAIYSCSGGQVIVDTSKSPQYGFLLGMIPGIDLYVVHLVRDSRAVAFSWRRKTARSDVESRDWLPEYGPLITSVRWVVRNLLAEILLRRKPAHYLAMRYSGFVKSPRESVQSILDLVGESGQEFSFVGEHQVNLKPTHTVSGNPARMRTGLVKLQLDDEWRSKMKRTDKMIVAALTWPLLSRYRFLDSQR